MGAPSASRMAQLAKTQFCQSGQILPLEFPISYMVNPHWPGAFVAEDLQVPPLPVNPKAALFVCVSANRKHVQTQGTISAIFHLYIDGICKAICCAWHDWAKQAVLQNVVINGAMATSGQVTGPKWKPIIVAKGPRETKMKKLYTRAIAEAIGKAWASYEMSLTTSGLAWYPPFALATPGPAAPMENIPVAVSRLMQYTSSLERGALADSMLRHLHTHVSMAQVISVASTATAGGIATAAVGAVKDMITGSIRPHAAALMDAIAYAFETCFKQWQATSLVTKVFGSGVNPSNIPGPIVSGLGNMSPGGFESAMPDASMLLGAIAPSEGFVSGVYDDNARGPNASKPTRGLHQGGSRAIGYGTDLGRTFDPKNLTSEQLFKRRLFKELSKDYEKNEAFEAFMRQELFLRDGEAEKLFELSMFDAQDGYVTWTQRLFPNLNSYSLDHQVALIDLIYNYGPTNLRDTAWP